MWPLVVLLVSPRWLLRTLIATELAVIVGRCWWVYHYGSSVGVSIATITRMDGLIFGAICAAAVREMRFPRRAVALLPAIFAVCLPAALFGRKLLPALSTEAFDLYFAIPLLAVGFSAVVLIAVLTDGESTWVQSFLAGTRSPAWASTPMASMFSTSPSSTT